MPHRAADRRVAEELSATIAGIEHRRTWRRATTLLDDFGSYALTDDVRERIVSALEEAGVQARPPIQEANRHDTIRLALASDGRRSTLGDTPSAAELVAVTEWRPGEAPRAIALDDVEGAEGIVWFDVDVLQADEESVCELVLPHCRGQLTREIVVDLLDAWLPGVTDDVAAVRLAELIDRALRQLFEISEVLRGSIDLMSSSLAQAQRAQESASRTG
ncbi:MAG: hypothetical protein WKF40_06265 [Thermoleophilaceae bacterium]